MSAREERQESPGRLLSAATSGARCSISLTIADISVVGSQREAGYATPEETQSNVRWCSPHTCADRRVYKKDAAKI